ncbi:Ig-like domain-containing protein [Pseudomonas edaphica]|uniref:Ig-like domain-containing protein n=1 Tax=Pseudomonas edaphica TaxID=2006980 RepID=UPI0023EF6147|nr:Ig-like domain-containing protein [Pseudomonas edaphica]
MADNTVDVTPPAAPSDLVVVTLPDGKLKLSGSAEANSKVTVTLPDNTTRQVTTDSNGHFELTSNTVQPNGTVKVIAADAAGNASTQATIAFVADSTVDVTPPAPPTGLLAVTLPDGKAKISGSAEANSKVTVILPDGTTQQVTAGANGAFELTSNGVQPNGTVQVAATDVAGNTGTAASVDFVANNTVDTTPPAAPTGLVAVTLPDGKVKINGNAEANSKISVRLPDGTTQQVTADLNGAFELISSTAQPNGTVQAVATDAAGNASMTTTINFVVDNAIDVTPPPTPSGLLAVTLPDGKLKLSGSAEANSKITVILPDGTTQLVTTGPNGAFELTSNGVQPNGAIQATSTDAAGNASGTVTVNFVADNTVDVTPPAAPTGLLAVTLPDGKVKISGSAEAHSKVTVILSDGTTQQVTAGANGAFELTSNAAQPNGAVQATATDAAGNVSAQATITFAADNTVDVTPPAPPTGLLAVTLPDGKVKVSGSAEANSKITVILPDGTTQQVTAGANGTFELTSNGVQPNGLVQAAATDAAGNAGTTATVNFVADNTIDVTPPQAPTFLVQAQPNGTVKVNGTAEANSKVTITLTDGIPHEVTADLNGNYELIGTTAQNITGNITLVVKDAAGNQSVPVLAPFTPLPAPDAPTFTTNTTDAGTGLVTITGTALANTKVRLTFPDGTVQDVTSSPTGTFSFTSALPQEAARFSAVAIGTNGRESLPATGEYLGNPATVYNVSVDGYIDNVPTVPGDADVRQPTSTPTDDNTPTLYGTALGAGLTGQVVVFEGTTQVAVANLNRVTGAWTALLPVTADGTHNYTVQIINALGTSKTTRPTSLTIDTIDPLAPVITLMTVTEQGTTVPRSLALTGGKTSDNTPTLSGTAEANATVILYHLNADGREAEVGRVQASSTGTWVFESNFLTNRVQTLYVKAQDAASNASVSSNRVTVDIAGPTKAPAEVTVGSIWSVDGAGDVDGDGFDDISSASYDVSGGFLRALLRGSNTIEAVGPKFYNNANGVFTYHQAGVGDTNGDGFNDTVAMYGDRNSTANGTARLYLGAGSMADTWVSSNLTSARFVASAGDLDGDGLADVVLGGSGAYGQNSTSSIRFGTTGTTGQVQNGFNFGAAQNEVGGAPSAAFSGAQYVTSAGDFNGDGIGDIVTARGITFGQSARADINKSANVSWSTNTNALAANQAQAVSGIGDVNGDGFADVAVHDGRGVFVVFGASQARGSQSVVQLDAAWLQSNNRGFALDTSWRSTQPTTYGDIRGVGDVNGDGLADFAYTTYGNTLNNGTDSIGKAGQGGTGDYSNSYLIFGKTDTGTINVKSMTSQQGTVVPRGQADGASIAGRVDLNGDGLADIYVGSYSGNGKLYLGGTSLGAEPSTRIESNGVAIADANSNFIVGSSGRDTLFGKGGTDVIYAGSGDDVIVLNQDNLTQLAAGFNASAGTHGRLARVDGGNGIDTLAFEHDVTAVDLTTISNASLGMIESGVGLSRLSNVERIDLQGSNKAKLTLELKDVMDMNAGLSAINNRNFSSGLADGDVKRHQLVIDGSSDNTVEVKNSGEWITSKSSTVFSNGHAYDVYNSVGENKGQLLIEQTVNVTWA